MTLFSSLQDATELVSILEQQNNLEKNSERKKRDQDIQIFQVIDRLTEQPIVIWPQPLRIPSIETIISKTNHITLKEFKNSSFCAPHQLHGGSNIIENISCSRHFYACSKIEIFDSHPANFQRILIPYGNIIFESLQISSVGPYMPLINSQSYSSPFLSRGATTAVKPSHASIMEATYRSKSIDDSDLVDSRLRRPFDCDQRHNTLMEDTASLLSMDMSSTINNNISGLLLNIHVLNPYAILLITDIILIKVRGGEKSCFKP